MATLIDENDYAASMAQTVSPALADCAREGWMTPARHPGLTELAATTYSHDGLLHYMTYRYEDFPADLRDDVEREEAKGTIVISHGYTEFIGRYDEIAYYFLAGGYSVAIMEDRGHGYSPRDIENFDLVWIDDWRRYVVDLKKFCEKVARRLTPGRPLSMYAHSMGGGIAIALTEQYPTTLDSLVLSAPMVVADMGVPSEVAPAALGALAAGRGGMRAVRGQKPFPAWDESLVAPGLSLARGKWLYDLRAEDAHYQNFEATYGWAREMTRLSHSIRRPEAIARIITPTLLIQSAADTSVDLPSQDAFVADLKEVGGTASQIRIEGAPHEQGSLPNSLLGEVIDEALAWFDYYDSPAPWEYLQDDGLDA